MAVIPSTSNDINSLFSSAPPTSPLQTWILERFLFLPRNLSGGWRTTLATETSGSGGDKWYWGCDDEQRGIGQCHMVFSTSRVYFPLPQNFFVPRFYFVSLLSHGSFFRFGTSFFPFPNMLRTCFALGMGYLFTPCVLSPIYDENIWDSFGVFRFTCCVYGMGNQGIHFVGNIVSIHSFRIRLRRNWMSWFPYPPSPLFSSIHSPSHFLLPNRQTSTMVVLI